MTLVLPMHRARSAGALAPTLFTMACLLLAGLWQLSNPANSDESWLLDVAGRVLDGGRFYVDFLEVNPPASVLLYVPAAALARLLSIKPMAAVDLLVLVEFAASTALGWSILRAAGLAKSIRADVALALAAAVLILLPLYAFGQREHIALLALLPLLGCAAARAAGHPPSRWQALLAGLGAGICLSIKPQFGLALVGPAAFLLLAASWRSAVAAIEGWTALAVAGLYGLGVAVLCPIFAAEVLPVALAVYVPVRQPLGFLLLLPGFTVWLVLMAVTLVSRRWSCRPAPLQTVLMLASAGFQLAALLQGKGFGYHFYPAVALALLAAALPVLRRERDGGLPLRWRATQGLAATLAALSGMALFTAHYDPDFVAPGLTGAIAAVAPHPTVMAVTPEITLGHPTVEALGGRWVGRLSHNWISQGVYRLTGTLQDSGPLARYVNHERSVFAEDLLRERPDVVLVDGERWLPWIAADPALAAAFARYVKTGTYGPVMLWTRRDLLR